MVRRILISSIAATALGLLLQLAAYAERSSGRFEALDNGGPTTSQGAGTRQNADEDCFKEGSRRLGGGACSPN